MCRFEVLFLFVYSMWHFPMDFALCEFFGVDWLQIFMDNFEYNNFGAFNLRSVVLVQLIACFPLKAYVLRSRAMQMVFGHIYPR